MPTFCDALTVKAVVPPLCNDRVVEPFTIGVTTDELAVAVVNTPVVGIVLPIGVLLMLPNVIATLDIAPPVIWALAVDRVPIVAVPVTVMLVNSPDDPAFDASS